MPRARRPRLVYRLYAVGVVQVVLVLVTAVAIGWAVARLSFDVHAVAERLAAFAAEPARLQAEVTALKARDGTLLTIYDDAGNVVASSAEPPLRAPRFGGDAPPFEPPPPPNGGPPEGPPPWSEGPPFHFGPPPGGPHGGPRPPEMFARFSVGGREGFLVARFERPKPSLVPPLLTLVSGLLVVGVGAFLTSRWIARPLEQLSRAARSLGQGDLRVRAGLHREDELGEVGHAFDEMADRLRDLLLAEKELLANVSHELRTPLARIRVALEIASEGDAVAARASLSEIALDLTEIEALVEDILTATRLEMATETAGAPGFSLHRASVAPEAIAERAAARFRTRHPERGLDVEITGPLPALHADAALLRRALDNLLENAHKYGPEATRGIRLSVAPSAGRVAFEVEDHGIGIPEEDLPRLFTAFFRGERSRSRGTGGVGLGLTLAKRIVDAHGGTIEVKSTPKTGTRVSIFVPSEHQTDPE